MQIDEKKEIIDYLQSFIKKSGSIHEEDIFTQIIRNLLTQIKEKGKSVILIIDDLDRIDPEHIFRILNIFAAHFDSPSYKCEQNKFGFNQIMLVCDLKNIRNIFYNKYGQNVDFTGYIDKFYSKDVFVFDNIRVLQDTIHNVLSCINYCSISKTSLCHPGEEDYLFKLLSEFISNCVLNIRDLEKVWKLDYSFNSKIITLNNNQKKSTKQFYELILIDFLIHFFGDIENLKMAIHKIKKSNLKGDLVNNNIKECLKILTLFAQDQHDFHYIKAIPNRFLDKHTNQTIEFRVMNSVRNDVYWLENQYEGSKTFNYFELLYDVIEMAQTKKYLN